MDDCKRVSSQGCQPGFVRLKPISVVDPLQMSSTVKCGVSRMNVLLGVELGSDWLHILFFLRRFSYRATAGREGECLIHSLLRLKCDLEWRVAR